MAKRKSNDNVLTTTSVQCPSPQLLWESGDAKDWRKTLALHDQVIGLIASKGGKKANLPRLNEWFYQWKPKEANGVSKDNLIKMME